MAATLSTACRYHGSFDRHAAVLARVQQSKAKVFEGAVVGRPPFHWAVRLPWLIAWYERRLQPIEWISRLSRRDKESLQEDGRDGLVDPIWVLESVAARNPGCAPGCLGPQRLRIPPPFPPTPVLPLLNICLAPRPIPIRLQSSSVAESINSPVHPIDASAEGALPHPPPRPR